MPEKTKIMINPVNGGMGKLLLRLARSDPTIEVLPYSLGGRNTQSGDTNNGILMIPFAEREEAIKDIKRTYGHFVALDFAKGLDGNKRNAAVAMNSAFYDAHEIPFVIGATAGDLAQITRIPYLAATNMNPQVAAFQHETDRFVVSNRDLFAEAEGYALDLIESHQGVDQTRPDFSWKKDVSGTGDDIRKKLNRLGLKLAKEEIVMIRDREEQKRLGVPDKQEILDAHGWHTYIATYDGKQGPTSYSLHNVLGKFWGDFVSRHPSMIGFDKASAWGREFKGITNNMEFFEELIARRVGQTINSRGSFYAVSPNRDVAFEYHYIQGRMAMISHNINTREPYGRGSLDAAKYLAKVDVETNRGMRFGVLDAIGTK